MPETCKDSRSFAKATISEVLYPPAPPITGTRPWASATVISTTRKCSSRVSVGFSPVVPQGDKKLMPASIWRSTSFFRVASSSEKSRRNGVTGAAPHPLNIAPPSKLNTAADSDRTGAIHREAARLPRDFSPKGGGVRRSFVTRSLRRPEQHFAELEPAFFPNHPSGGLQCAPREPFAAARGMAQGDGLGGRIAPNFVRSRVGSRAA